MTPLQDFICILQHKFILFTLFLQHLLIVCALISPCTDITLGRQGEDRPPKDSFSNDPCSPRRATRVQEEHGAAAQLQGQ